MNIKVVYVVCFSLIYILLFVNQGPERKKGYGMAHAAALPVKDDETGIDGATAPPPTSPGKLGSYTTFHILAVPETNSASFDHGAASD